jgi:hypothetical protein
MSKHDHVEDEFGFDSLRSTAKDRIRDIKPSGPPETVTDFARIDAIAASAGFISREGSDQQKPYQATRAPRPEPRSALNMRVPVTLGIAFQRFCGENRYSYPEGLEEIMKRAGLPLV